MPIIFPDFKDRKCLELTFCGYVFASDYTGTEQPPALTGGSLIAEYKPSSEPILARLVPPYPRDADGDFHIHVDLARASSKKAEPNASIGGILEKLEPFLGQKAYLFLRGTFRVSEIHSPLLRPMLAEYTVGNVQVRLTGGTLKVSGTPIETISWRLEEGGSARIELETRTDQVLTESYLVEGLDLLESAFKAMFKEKGNE